MEPDGQSQNRCNRPPSDSNSLLHVQSTVPNKEHPASSAAARDATPSPTVTSHISLPPSPISHQPSSPPR
ncbi:uncharacterized protein BO66DRAFT_394352 [Aspergillus aculeatinus CBS 121060]|uniref:Uncharacterized protein n=1 Tax=Aspergillus aculeatinus CBS 121060 TaxID=1448322 RepID=A0ACD1H039_9EURO|nr:hypothetical protein BO66DRAFT_394352 [Aspergillus aculeatinus CBS 121060]RAH66834.1 hypothetical protein BO66DRAFT_394352 [Aspergillus aculeatinus CBS 121060]